MPGRIQQNPGRGTGMESRADAWAVLKITSGLGSRHDVDPAAHTWISVGYP
jgi:hypothetical protein